MKNPRKTRKIRNKMAIIKKIYKGGLVFDGILLPITTELVQFPITNESILSFNRIFVTPMDCVISALQVIGALDNIAANIMRITSLGRSIGITKEEIEIIFIYLYNKNFGFMSFENVGEWESAIALLEKNRVFFAGFKVGGGGHVFLIARDNDGNLLYIDPQQTPALCNVLDPLCNLNQIIKDNQGNIVLYLLYNSQDTLNDEQQLSVVDYVSKMQVAVAIDTKEAATSVTRAVSALTKKSVKARRAVKEQVQEQLRKEQLPITVTGAVAKLTKTQSRPKPGSIDEEPTYEPMSIDED